MTLNVKWSAGDGRYLWQHAEEGVSERERRRKDNYYLKAAEHGEPAGQWLGRGAQGLGLTGEVRRSQMEVVYGQLVHPETGEALGSRPRKYASEEANLAKLLAAEPEASPERRATLEIEARKGTRSANSYADLTFSPTKSWSVLHAALERDGRYAEADEVWAAWMTGVEAGLDYLQSEAGYSRTGYHGNEVAQRTSGRWVDGHNWVMSAWRHHTSRDGDPQLHVHVAVLNRVLNADGTWRSLDSRAIARVRPAAEALAHRVAEGDLERRLGVRFATRPDGVAREIVGISEETRDLFSSRRRAIKGKVADLAKAYEERHGAPPKAYQLTLMTEHVTLITRARKPEHPPARAELLDRWEAATVGLHGKTLAQVLDRVEMGRAGEERDRDEVFDPDQVVRQALAHVDRSKSVWTRHDLIGTLGRHLPDSLGGLDASATRSLLDELADRALASDAVLRLTAPEAVSVPDQLRRSDGYSFWEPHRAERYTTASGLNREERLVKIAESTGARRVRDAKVNRYLTKHSTLSPAQADVARAVVTSGRRVEVLVGPAGTGKSHTVGEIAGLWTRDGGNVVGITVAENAARVLGGEGIDRAANAAKFLMAQDDIEAGRATKSETSLKIDRKTLVIIDEASMMTTPELARLVELSHEAGAKVLVTGDDRQLGAVGVGGAMRLLAREVPTHELCEVHRFDAEWEGPASLALRSGDTAALEDYDRRGRIVEGDSEAMKEAAYRGFLADHLSNKASVLVTSTNDQAAELGSRVRADLVDLGRVEPDGVRLRDATEAGRGDLIQTRRNDAKLTDHEGRPVVNRDVYLVTRRDQDSLQVRRQLGGDGALGPEMTLPGAYVSEHVELAYASTIHGAQGRTLDTSHLLVDEATSRAGLYVGMSRGRESNVAYVVTATEAHDGRGSAETNRFAVLSSVMERDDADRSATEVLATELDASESLARLGPIWADCVAEDGRQRHTQTLAEALGPERATAVCEDPAAGALWRSVRAAELDGHDPRQLLTTVAANRELDTADSVAQVLHHRLEAELRAGTRPNPAPRTFAERTPEPLGLDPGGIHEPYGAHARRLAVVMDARREDLGERATRDQPPWTADLGPVPSDPLDRARWADQAATVAAYREMYSHDSPTDPIGPAPPRGGDADRRQAWEEAWTALGRPERDRDVARRTDGELSELVEKGRREERWAPPWVGDQLREAHLSERYWTTQAVMEEAGRERPPSADGGAAPRARQIADDMALRRAALTEVDSARVAWYEHTQETRDLAEGAARELARRHPEPTTRDAGVAERHEPAAHEPAAHEPAVDERREDDLDRSLHNDRTAPGAPASPEVDRLSDEEIAAALVKARGACHVIAQRREEVSEAETAKAAEYVVQRSRTEREVDRGREVERGPSFGY